LPLILLFSYNQKLRTVFHQLKLLTSKCVSRIKRSREGGGKFGETPRQFPGCGFSSISYYPEMKIRLSIVQKPVWLRMLQKLKRSIKMLINAVNFLLFPHISFVSLLLTAFCSISIYHTLFAAFGLLLIFRFYSMKSS